MAFTRMRMESAQRRLRVLANILTSHIKIQRRFCSSQSDTVTIGDILLPRRTPANPELVPLNYVTTDMPQYTLRHLRWMGQKDLLGQDIFLIGPPGPFRRTLAMQYLELVGREMEYVSLSRDTTESDLKQRREITSSTAHYVDQCAVKAALNGRVLVVDGIEKAERNVLPVINNLLENREMQLEDGRFLMAAARYDKLLKEHTKEELDAWKLVRVSEDFRVIALGLPIPRYRGHPLDPPLRSRFQGRNVDRLPFNELNELLQAHTSVPARSIHKILSFAYMFVSKESESLGLPDFPIDGLPAIVKLLESLPELPSGELLHRVYPYDIFSNKEGRKAIEDALQTFNLVDKGILERTEDIGKKATSESRYEITEVVHDEGVGSGSQNFANVRLCTSFLLGSHANLKVLAGTKRKPLEASNSTTFVATTTHQAVLSQIVQSHLVGDFCIVGPKGSGKSALVKEFARILGYELEPFVMYRDVTSRDMLQQRATLPNGDTVWRLSPLVTAALEGKLLVLDGIHRVDSGTLAVLHRLVHDRELQLYDGTRLLSPERYDRVKSEHGYSDEELSKRGVWRVHPSFRIAALAEPPESGGAGSKRWLDSELLTLFLYHHLHPLEREQEMYVLSQLGIDVSNKVEDLLNVAHSLRTSSDPALHSLSASLSTRQLLRLSRRLNAYPSDSVYSLVQNACLARFLPALTKTAFESQLHELNIVPDKVAADSSSDGTSSVYEDVTCAVKDGILQIGRVQVPLYSSGSPSKVPDIVFYDIPQHLHAMEGMLKDFLQGEHLLLIGNQGVGKNKIVDRFLQLLNRPREYMQLHRDTTVQTLTLQPTVHDGVIVYEDSPLVRALKLGHILMVDEADKAPAHVVCVLKTLLESGEMLLSDGRRVILPEFAKDSIHHRDDKYLIMHPDFRMIVLANRPGFPFLGNDFYSSLGDIFACHPIDNPDFQSEMAMLKQYGPDVPDGILGKLARAFSELRSMADSGLLAYPYSTREAVSIVRHLQHFPSDSLSSVIKNVFDFDSYGKETVESVSKVLQKHGIPVGVVVPQARLSKEYELPSAKHFGRLKLGAKVLCGDRDDFLIEKRPISLKEPVLLYNNILDLDKTDHRASKFGEIKCSWKLPLHYTNVVSDIKVTTVANGLHVHVATSSPVHLYTFDINSPTVSQLELGDLFPSVARGTYKPRIRMAPLGDSTRLFLYDELSGTKVVVDSKAGSAQVVEQPHALVNTAENFMRRITGDGESFFHLSSHLASTDQLLISFRPSQNQLEILDLRSRESISLALPLKLLSVHSLSRNSMFVLAEDQKKYLLKMASALEETTLYEFESEGEFLQVADLIPRPVDAELASVSFGVEVPSGKLALPFCQPDTFANLALGLSQHPDEVDLYSVPRTLPSLDYDPSLWEMGVQSRRRFEASCAVEPSEGTFLRVYPATHVPQDANPEGRDLNFLEVVDLWNKNVRYLPVDKPIVVSPYAAWLTTRTDTGTMVCPTGEGGVIVSDLSGTVHLYEIGSAKLRHSLAEWQQMLGDPEHRRLQVTIQKPSGKPVTAPKFGKIDPQNAPHVGGNTWAGGTGGRDTAGLGGVGGPFRLDSGNPVFQVSNMDIASVPEEVRKAAREMARKAHQERLREIKMSQYDAEEYEKFSSSIQPQVKMLRVMLDNLQAKGKERQWLHHQTTGELDDVKIVEGLTGEKSVYKRRGDQDPEPGSPQQLPKRLKLLVDVSGSTYRFNGFDRRLERILECALMMMEAFENYEHKFQYELIGHSGDDFDVTFVRGKDVPKNNKERMDVLKMMYAHAQFCGTGDNTLEATSYAMKKILDEDKADEYFVIVLSDANFDRYGISPQQFARILTSESRVNGYAIFIGSLGDQAQRLKEALPAGRAFVCLDTAEVPRALQQIFTSSILNVGGGTD